MSESESEQAPVYSAFFGAIGAAVSMILCAVGSGYATAIAGTAISAAATRKPEAIMKTILPVVMAGIIAIYGLVASVLILNSLDSSAEGYSEHTGYLHFGSGISVGMSGLAAGYAIGKVGASGVRTMVKQPSYFIGMVLILIFAEVLGLYGLILGLVLATK